jgi:hypothetical protein
MNYARDEFVETSRRVFAPGKACAAAVKQAINACAKTFKISEHRARDLMRGRLTPRVEEMDKLRELDGRWCRIKRAAKETTHEMIEEIAEFVRDLKARRKAKREARLSQKHPLERMYDRA